MLKPVKCPNCDKETTIISRDNRYKSSGWVIRYRDCPTCKTRYMTKQRVDDEDKIETIFRSYQSNKHFKLDFEEE